jgi:hypothetical protein
MYIQGLKLSNIAPTGTQIAHTWLEFMPLSSCTFYTLAPTSMRYESVINNFQSIVRLILIENLYYSYWYYLALPAPSVLWIES